MASYFQVKEDTTFWKSVLGVPKKKAVFLCAIIIMQSIADNSPYLAALGDAQECISKWNPHTSVNHPA